MLGLIHNVRFGLMLVICTKYSALPIRDAVRLELSWTHYRSMLKVEYEVARMWYMNKSANEGSQTVLNELSKRLTDGSEKGFMLTNLRYMLIYIRHAVRDELSWMHHR